MNHSPSCGDGSIDRSSQSRHPWWPAKRPNNPSGQCIILLYYRMARTKKTWYAILGLLAWKPMSGYDIKKFVEIGLSHFWNESYGQLFPTLARLVDEGLAVKRNDPGSGRRKRFIYAITPRGHEALDEWLNSPSAPVRTRNEHQLKFFLSCRRPTQLSLKFIEEQRAQLLERLEDYTESEAILAAAAQSGVLPEEVEALLRVDDEMDPEIDRHREALTFYLTLRQGILVLRARLSWCDEAVAALRSTPATAERMRQ